MWPTCQCEGSVTVWEQAGCKQLGTPLMSPMGTTVSDVTNPGGGLKDDLIPADMLQLSPAASTPASITRTGREERSCTEGSWPRAPSQAERLYHSSS